MSSYSFSVRDNVGDLIYAEAQNIGVTTNMEAEVTVVWKALRFCQEQGFQHIKIERDSLCLRNMVKGIWKAPWKIVDKIEEILAIMETTYIHFEHIFREANQQADFIANTAIHQQREAAVWVI